MEKYCKNCKSYKKFDDYHKHKKGLFGLYPICKICRKEKQTHDIKIITDKECKKCNKTFKVENFYKNKNNKDGYQSECKICYIEKRSNNQSKIFPYMKLLLKKFCKLNKNSVSFDENDMINLYINQNKKCYITGHQMTHSVDNKGRIDNIYNISIMPIVDKKTLNIDDIKLVINLFYSVGLKYKLDSEKILTIYRELTCRNCDLC